MGDSINRKDAIDAFGLSEKTRKYGGDHSGYNTMMLYEIQDILEEIPSAVPEVIQCKDCKYAILTCDGVCKFCEMWKDDDGNLLELYADEDFYCANAERKEQ